MREIHLTLEAVDGHPLAATLFEPPGKPLAAVQINGATGVPRRYYGAYARFLSDQGFAVLTYDYRGIGDSRFHAARDEQISMLNWGERDYASMLQHLHERYPQRPLLAVGHSVGGQLLGLAPNNHLLTAALGIAAQSGYWGHWPRHLQPQTAALWYLVFPLLLALRGRIPKGVMGEELPAGIAGEWARWCRNPAYISDVQGQPLRRWFRSYTGRMRLLAISDDLRYAPPAAVQALAGFYENANVEVATLRPQEVGMRRIGHFGFFQPRMARTAWQQTADWLRAAATSPLSQAA